MTETPANRMVFRKGAEDVIASKLPPMTDWNTILGHVRDQIAEALNAKYVSFLFGAGTSSLIRDSAQLGIPTMQPLAKEFTSTIGDSTKPEFLTMTERERLVTTLGLDISRIEFATNLEHLMEVLYSYRFALSNSVHSDAEDHLSIANVAIEKTQRFIFQRCTSGRFSNGDTSVLSIYERFYRKLAVRDRNLPKPWVFTSNYDLFNEGAMDRIGLHYCNGFSGNLERRFNPAVFRYALAEQLDTGNRKWTAVDGYIYLVKLHGSVSWWEGGEGMFPIRESQTPENNSNVMIFPTPAKQNSSLGSPYSDLFREFQSRITQPQSVLFVVGYRFGDEHINNIIYQALTVPTFRLIIVADPESEGEIGKLRTLGDPRIWLIGGRTPNGTPVHYFDEFVGSLMPQRPADRIEGAVTKALTTLMRREVPDGEDDGVAR